MCLEKSVWLGESKNGRQKHVSRKEVEPHAQNFIIIIDSVANMIVETYLNTVLTNSMNLHFGNE